MDNFEFSTQDPQSSSKELKMQTFSGREPAVHRPFEESKGRGFSIVTDTPELQRLKRTQEQISNVGALLLDGEVPWSVSLGRNVRLNVCEA